MQMTSPFWKNFLLSLLALLLSAGVGELILRCCVSVRNVGPSFTVYDPIYGKKIKKSFACRRIAPEFTMKFTTNREGFRGPAMESPPLRSILFLGDSFTMGYGVNDGEEFPSLVRKAMNRGSPDNVSIVNAGIGNNGNGRWIKFLRAEGKRYNPELIVFQIHSNDFRDNVREQLFEITPGGDLRERPLTSPGPRWLIQNVIESFPGLAYSYLIGFARQVFWDRKSSSPDHDPDTQFINQEETTREEHLLIRIMEEVLRICKENGWNILIIMVDISGDRSSEMQKFFLARNVSTIAIPTKEERPDLYYRIDGHWNARGHRYAADRIFEHLKNRTHLNALHPS